MGWFLGDRIDGAGGAGRRLRRTPERSGCGQGLLVASALLLVAATAGADSVTEAATSPEIITVTRAQFTQSEARWVIQGLTTVPGPPNSVTVRLGSLAGTVAGTAPVDAAGNWKLDVRNSPAVPDSIRTISVQSSSGGSVTDVPVTIR